MAYATGASLNSVLLNQLNFRTSANAPISSLYTLYANGQGQTYWSNSINPSDLSTLSTTIGTVYQQVESDLQKAIISTNNATSTLIYNTLGNYGNLSSQLGVLTRYTVSSFSTVFYVEALNSTNIGNVVVNNTYAFLSTSNSFQIQLNSYYLSTLNVMYSTVNAISSISTFLVQINAVQTSVNIGLSTVSTSAALQTTLTSNVLTSTFNYQLLSSFIWTSSQISSIYASQVSINQLNTFSTQINSSLISTATYLSNRISTTNSVVSSISTRVSTLELQYNTISTTTIYTITSTFFSTNISPINVSLYSQSTLLGRTISSLNTFSTIYYWDISSLVQSTNNNIVQISSLSYQFSIITTSSILAGIYDTFIQLEAYSVNIINSTYTASIYIASTVTSTTVGIALASTMATQIITLNNQRFSSVLNFVNYQNFNIQLYNIANTNTYRISYDPTTLSNLNSKQGIITVDVRTLGQGYTQNGNLLALDISRWGIINNSYQSQFPMIANSEYTAEYQYNILNNLVYANLVNVYPRISTSAITVSSIYSNTSLGPTTFSSGTQLFVSWKNYLFSTFGVTPYYAQVNVDVVDINYNTAQTFGPYIWATSSATITMPSSLYYPRGYGLYEPIAIKSYIVGQPSMASVFTGQLYIP